MHVVSAYSAGRTNFTSAHHFFQRFDHALRAGVCALALVAGCTDTSADVTAEGVTLDQVRGDAGLTAVRDAAAGSAGSASAQDSGRASAVPSAGKPVCSGDALCADFEDQTGTTLQGSWSVVAPNCAGDGKIAIDEQVAHGGRRALRISSSGGYCNHVFATPKLEAGRLAGVRWLRWYLRVSEALGDGHVTFLAMHDKVSGKDLRMGGQSRILMWNRERDDATLPELSPTGIGLSAKLTVNAWQCVEVLLDGPRGGLETYLDGKRVEGLVIDQTPTADIDGQWLRPGKWTADVDDLRIGWESYGSQKMTLWVDDVVVSAARPGC